MPRPPPVTSTLRIASLLVVAAVVVRAARIALLGLLVEHRMQGLQIAREARRVDGPRHAQCRREEVAHVQLLAELVAVLAVEPEPERGAGDEDADRDRAQAPRAAR